jgi:DNA-binding XRE family transcriptional regulator
MDEKLNSEKEKSPLKLFREERDIEQEDLADMIGVNVRSVRSWENTSAMPSLDKAARLCSSLGISFKQLCQAKGLDISSIPDDAPLKSA